MAAVIGGRKSMRLENGPDVGSARADTILAASQAMKIRTPRGTLRLSILLPVHEARTYAVSAHLLRIPETRFHVETLRVILSCRCRVTLMKDGV